METNDLLPRFIILEYNDELTVELAKLILNGIRVKYYYKKLAFATVDKIEVSTKNNKYVVPFVCRRDANDLNWLREIIVAINVDNGTVYIDSKYSSVFSKLVNLYQLANF